MYRVGRREDLGHEMLTGLSFRFDAMQGLAHLVDERLGGIKVYAVKQLGFSSADVERIRNNLQPSSIAI